VESDYLFFYIELLPLAESRNTFVNLYSTLFIAHNALNKL